MAKRGTRELLRSAVASLTASFAFSALAAPAAVAPEQPIPATRPASAAGYWKSDYFDAVIRLDECGPTPEKVCASFYWLNPKDTKIFDYFGDTSKSREADTFASGGNSFRDRSGPDDVRALCGYSPRVDFHAAGDRHWKGTLELRGKGMNVNADVTQTDDNTLSLIMSKAFITQNDTWHRVKNDDPRYPACKKPGGP